MAADYLGSQAPGVLASPREGGTTGPHPLWRFTRRRSAIANVLTVLSAFLLIAAVVYFRVMLPLNKLIERTARSA